MGTGNVAASSVRRALADVRLICTSGAGSAAVPAAMQAARRAIGCDAAFFGWQNAQAITTHLYSDDASTLASVHKIGAAQRYMNEFVGRPAAVLPADADLIRRGQRLDNTGWYGQLYVDSDFFNEIFRPLHLRHMLRSLAYERRKPLGVAVFARTPGETGFGKEEEAVAAQIGSCLTHALAAPPPQVEDWADTSELGMAVLRRDGRLEWLSDQARALLEMASVPDVEPAGAAMSERLSLLALRLNDSKGIPMMAVRGALGIFVFRAYRLDPVTPGGDGGVGVTISRRVPAAVRFSEALLRCPELSVRQKEVALRLALGRSHEWIAADLGIGHSSVITHRRALYNRLNVRSREQLVKKVHGALSGPDRI